MKKQNPERNIVLFLGLLLIYNVVQVCCIKVPRVY